MKLLLTDTGHKEVKQCICKEMRVTAFQNWHSVLDRRKGELERVRKRWWDQDYLRIIKDSRIILIYTQFIMTLLTSFSNCCHYYYYYYYYLNIKVRRAYNFWNVCSVIVPLFQIRDFCRKKSEFASFLNRHFHFFTQHAVEHFSLPYIYYDRYLVNGEILIFFTQYLLIFH
jgi:hypothetical protein